MSTPDFGDFIPDGAAWVELYGRAGKLGEPQWRQMRDDVSLHLEADPDRDDLDSGTIVVTAADLQDEYAASTDPHSNPDSPQPRE